MPLDIPDGERCFIDANILYYHFVDIAPFSETSANLLQRSRTQNYQAIPRFM